MLRKIVANGLLLPYAPIQAFKVFFLKKHFYSKTLSWFNGTAARLAQLGKRWPAEQEVVSSNPGRTNTQGLKSIVFVMTSANDKTF